MLIKPRTAASLWLGTSSAADDKITIFRVRRSDQCAVSIARAGIIEIAKALARKAAREDHARMFGKA